MIKDKVTGPIIINRYKLLKELDSAISVEFGREVLYHLEEIRSELLQELFKDFAEELIAKHSFKNDLNFIHNKASLKYIENIIVNSLTESNFFEQETLTSEFKEPLFENLWNLYEE